MGNAAIIQPVLDSHASSYDPTGLYKLEEDPIGGGSFGTVYKATDKKTKEVVAIKKIDYLIEGELEIKYVIREMSILAQCKSPYIVKMKVRQPYYLKMDKGKYQFWAVLEYCSEGSIEKYMNSCDKKELKTIMHDTLLGLDYLHQQKIIHRDISPRNILEKDGRYKLGDLGLARDLPDSLNGSIIQCLSVCGDKDYMAPELKSGKYNEKVDIYAWGFTIYALAEDKESIMPFVNDCINGLPQMRPSAKQLLHKLQKI